MSAPTKVSQCPIHHATSALDSIEWGISVVNEIASMVAGIQAMAELPMTGVALAQLKKRMTSLSRLALLTVRFADGRSDILDEVRAKADETVRELTLLPSECWVPVRPDSMPPAEFPVVGWDATNGEPCAVFFDPNVGWILQCDPTTLHKGAISHWRYCNAPAAFLSEGATS